MNRDTVYFVSDAHFGSPAAGVEAWEQQFLQFLRDISPRASALYILGDLFDFWIEYRYAIRPDYFHVIHGLRQLVENKVPVHYFAGNHDFALGPFVSDVLGIQVHHDHAEMVLQGKKVYLFHGDGLLRRDVGYRLLRRVLRNPVNQRLYKMLHPNWGVRIGAACSGSSRKYLAGRNIDQKVQEYRMHAKRFLSLGNDIVFFGHTHHGEVVRSGAKVYCNTGAWLKHRNFATMKDGHVALWRYTAGGDPAPVEAIELK